MGITFKQFSTLVSEGRTAYSSEGVWKKDAEAAGYAVKKLSGNLADGDQAWGAFDDNDKKVGEFTEKEECRGGWLMEDKIFETFGMFRNNQKIDKLRAKDKKKPGEDDDEDQDDKNPANKNKKPDDEEQEEENPQDKFKKRSNSTVGTKSTRPLGRHDQKTKG